MYTLFVVALLLAFFFDTAAATSPVQDLTLPTAPMDQFYSGPDGMLSALCELCELTMDYCICNIGPPPQRADAFTPGTFYGHPDWPQASFVPPDEPETETETLPFFPPPYTEAVRQQLRDDIVRQFETNATTYQPSTVQIHVEGTYNPGDRLRAASLVGSRPSSNRRHRPKPGGFPCTVDDCGKVYDRSCDLKRHQKTHLERNERPHKCSICDEGFLYPKDLNRHQRRHDQSQSSQAMFCCSLPGCTNVEGFSRRDNLLRHQRRQHPQISVSA